MAERFYIIAQSFSTESFIEAMRPISAQWNVFTEDLFYGDVQYSDDKSMCPNSSESFQDENSGSVWIGLVDIEKRGRKALGGLDNRKFQKCIDKALVRLGTPSCTFVSFEFAGSTLRSSIIVEEITTYLLNNYEGEEFEH